MPLKLNSSGGGSVTLDTPSTASTYTLTVPAITGTAVVTGSSGTVSQGMLASGVAGNGPAFSAYQTVTQSVSTGTYAKVTLGGELFDTDNCFSSSRFTPNVAGYYQFNCIVRGVANAGTLALVVASFYKNGNFSDVNLNLLPTNGTTAYSAYSSLIYLNGSTDYVELYGRVDGTSPLLSYSSDVNCSRFSGFLVRAA